MSLVEYIQSNDPITNIPELLNLHHGNPLGISPIAQLIFIFIVAEVMAVFNFYIRNRGKSQYYPVLYSLLFVSLVSIYYYCFQSVLPTSPVARTGIEQPCIGWFCQPATVGTGWAIIGYAALTLVIYSILCAVMQVVAQLNVEAKMTEGKKWKEWKGAVILLMVGTLIFGITIFSSTMFASWALLVLFALIIIYVIVKIIADSVRCHNFWISLLIGLTFFIGIIGALMLTLECMRGIVFLCAFAAAILSNAKASKKQPKREA